MGNRLAAVADSLTNMNRVLFAVLMWVKVRRLHHRADERWPLPSGPRTIRGMLTLAWAREKLFGYTSGFLDRPVGPTEHNALKKMPTVVKQDPSASKFDDATHGVLDMLRRGHNVKIFYEVCVPTDEPQAKCRFLTPADWAGRNDECERRVRELVEPAKDSTFRLLNVSFH
jgi:hypothetical protein